jgi:hypothetical protein
MKNYGIKVSKEGNDVRSAIEDGILLTSEKECLKIVEKIEGTISIPNLLFSGLDYKYWEGSKNYTHGLTFVPAIRFFQQKGNDIIEAPSNYQDRASPTGPFVGWGYRLNAKINREKITVIVSVYYIDYDVPATDVDYILYIFANNLQATMLGPFVNRTYNCMGYGG